MRLFDRQFEIIVGESDSEAISIKNLAMKFEVKKVSSSKPIEGFVEIINVSDATDTFIKDKGQRIRIVGGYPGRVGLLFDGDVRRVERGRSGVDRITKIELGGNLVKLSNARFSRSYSGNVSIKQIIIDAIPSFGLTSNNLDFLPLIQKANFAFDGKTSDLLDKLLPINGVNWREDSGIITFSRIGQADDLINIPVISTGSGLIGIPGQTDKGGVKFRSLLDANLDIGKAVKLESDVINLSGGGRDKNVSSGNTNGFYKIISVNHNGETRGTPFYSDIEGIPIEQS